MTNVKRALEGEVDTLPIKSSLSERGIACVVHCVMEDCGEFIHLSAL